MDPLTPTNKPIPPLDPLTPSPTHVTTSPTARPSPETPTKSRSTPTYADLALKCESLQIGWEQQEKQVKAQETQLKTQAEQLETQEGQLETQEKQLGALREQQEKQSKELREQQEKHLEALREQQKNLSKEKGQLLRKLGRVLSSRKSLRVRMQELKARDVSRQTNTRLLVENKRLQKSLLDSLRSNMRVVARPDARRTRALKDDITSLQTQYETLQAERNDLQHQNHQMLAEGRSLVHQNNDLIAQLGTANDTIQSLHVFIAGLQSYAEKVVREKLEMELLVEGRLRSLTPKQRNWVRGMFDREDGARGRVRELGSWAVRVVERRRSTGEVGGLRRAVGTFPAKKREVDDVVQAEVPGADDLLGPEDVAKPHPADPQQSHLSTTAFALLIALFWVILFAMVLLAAGTIIVQDRRQIT
ncbi:hypothetical protein PRZ48_006535 [Zasmidium cellare]|uniref:Uncharacterized protein n=1 Tax=Zasmidium cellare TaxID=395010 RepID=A0ABR0EQM1_ZASCE|nr:hypothetical protein PRZ48_006535 [Zasmidium cellare]